MHMDHPPVSWVLAFVCFIVGPAPEVGDDLMEEQSIEQEDQDPSHRDHVMSGWGELCVFRRYQHHSHNIWTLKVRMEWNELDNKWMVAPIVSLAGNKW